MFDLGQTERQSHNRSVKVELSRPPSHRSIEPASHDSPPLESGDGPPHTALTRGWLIESSREQKAGKRVGASDRRFLQIGTGQWCGAEFATLFPLRRTAIAYAREFGLLVERDVEIVEHTTQP